MTATFPILQSVPQVPTPLVGRLIRVFPRRTKATPDDELAYTGPPDLFAYADEVHVSVAFTADKSIAERLADQWSHVAPVKIGGVAYEDDSLEFIPGRYIKPGYTITSRGCPRRCWNCGERAYKVTDESRAKAAGALNQPRAGSLICEHMGHLLE